MHHNPNVFQDRDCPQGLSLGLMQQAIALDPPWEPDQLQSNMHSTLQEQDISDHVGALVPVIELL
jgi:hypothetical protein